MISNRKVAVTPLGGAGDWLRRHTRWLLRLGVVAVLVWWLVAGADLAELGGVLRRLPMGAFAMALGLGGLTLGIAALRWRMLMRAFGVQATPPLRVLLRLVTVGHFYNTFVPGAVGGDVVRGVIMRRAFESPWASYVVVLLERLLGLSALGVVLLAGLVVGPPLVEHTTLALWIGLLLGMGVLVGGAAMFTRRLQVAFRQLPKVTAPMRLLQAFGISFLGHLLVLVSFGLLANGLDLPLAPEALLVVVPLGLVASFLPIAIAGIGPREAALVGLLGLLGLPRSEALGLSLAYAAVLLVLAGVGGLIQLIAPGGDPGTTQSSAAALPPG